MSIHAFLHSLLNYTVMYTQIRLDYVYNYVHLNWCLHLPAYYSDCGVHTILCSNWNLRQPVEFSNNKNGSRCLCTQPCSI